MNIKTILKKTNTLYTIPIRKIIITYDFLLKSPRIAKLHLKEKDFVNNGIIENIVINKNFELVDGYCSYIICKKYGIDRVPVYFVD